MDSNQVSNNYLKEAIEELSGHLSVNGDVPRETFADFINELKVSNLLIPSIISGEKMNFQILSDEDENILPLFSDNEEYERFSNKESDYAPIDNGISFYMDLVREYDLDGVIINPGSDDFLIEKELLLELPVDTGIEEEQALNPCSARELLEISKSTDNKELEKLLKNEDIDFESLMIELSQSTLFNLILTQKDISSLENDGIVKVDDLTEYSHCTTGDEKNQYGVLFTNINKIKEVLSDDAGNYYYQIALLDDYMEFILKSDMAGIIINPGMDDIVLPRKTLHEAHHGLTYNNPDYVHAIEYMFKV